MVLATEIIAKKMWHRGDHAKARDLFDLCAVEDADPAAINLAAPFFVRHGASFLRRLQDRAEFVRAEFEAIDTLGFQRSFDDCIEQAKGIVNQILQRGA